MRKASNTLLLIGAILSIVMAIVWMILAIIYLAAGAVVQAIIDGTFTGGSVPDIVIELERSGLTLQQIASTLKVDGVIFLLLMFVAIASCVLGFVARNKNNKGLFIANIVLGLACGAELNAIGGVLGLVASSRKE